MSHKGEWVLLTGATTPLGEALATGLAEAGYSLALHYCTKSSYAEQVAKNCLEHGVDAIAIAGDFSTPNGVEAFLARYLAMGVATTHLINHASLYAVGSLLDEAHQLLPLLLQVNLCAPIALIRALRVQLIKAKGSVVNFGVAGLERLQANIHHTAYHLSKLALWRATRALAKELAPEQLRVNMLSPGHLPHSRDLAIFVDTLPLGKPTQFPGVADALFFLIGNHATSITGQNLEVAGGALL